MIERPRALSREGDNPIASKIHSEQLLGLLAENSDTTVSVLIQPSLPAQRVEVKHVIRNGVPVALPAHVEPLTGEEQALVARRVDESRAFLEEVLGHSARWLPSARTFVARVTPEQLRQIANSPRIESIWPNRQRSSRATAFEPAKSR